MIENVDIASYADDVETKLGKASVKLFKQFHENGVKANQDKCHFLSSLDINTKFLPPVCILENSDSQKIATIDRKFNLSEHVTNLCDKASKKIQAPEEFSYIKRLLMNAYFFSNPYYCSSRSRQVTLVLTNERT